MENSSSVSLVEELPPAQRLALVYAPGRARQANLALLALDARLGAIIRNRREPMLTQIRLAWWREMFERSPEEWPRGDLVLEVLRQWRDPASLAELASGWEALLADDLTPPRIADFVAGRAEAFACLSDELGVASADPARDAAQVWALADLAANLSDGSERELVIEAGRKLTVPRLSGSLRPLAVLGNLGQLALERGGAPLLHGPRSALLALRVGFTGR